MIRLATLAAAGVAMGTGAVGFLARPWGATEPGTFDVGPALGQTAIEALAVLGDDAYFGPSCDRSTLRDRRASVYAEVEGDDGPLHVMAFLDGNAVVAVEVEDLGAAQGRRDSEACRALGAARHAERTDFAPETSLPDRHEYYAREELWFWPAQSKDGVVRQVYVSHEAHRGRCRVFERREAAEMLEPRRVSVSKSS